MGKALNELRILIVEDEPMLSLDLQDILADLGHRVVGTAPRLEPAIDLARNADFDVAVLDVNLGGERIDPVADIIAKRGLALVFVTGYGEAPAGHTTAPILKKPYHTGELERAIQKALIPPHE